MWEQPSVGAGLVMWTYAVGASPTPTQNKPMGLFHFQNGGEETGVFFPTPSWLLALGLRALGPWIFGWGLKAG